VDHSLTFARHFARLVWLILREPAAVDEQKATLRALSVVSKSGAVIIAQSDGQLTANGNLVPEAFSGASELINQLLGHSVKELVFEMSALPADLLGTARVFASVAPRNDEGRELDAMLRSLAPRTARIAFNRATRASGAVPVMRTSGAMPAMRTPLSTPIIGDPFAQPPEIVPSPAPPPPVTTATNGEALGLESASVSIRADAFSHDVTSEIVREFTAVDRPREAPDEFFSKLDSTNSISATSRLLDQVVVAVETSARDGKVVDAGDLFFKIVQRETEKTDPDLKRAYAAAIRRLSKPTVLRAVASVVPRRKERADDFLTILARAGEEGAEALIEQLTAAQSLSERRAYFDSLVKLQTGASTLTHMLGDARWYVARNAADLLGELNATDADAPLAELLKHDDDRVRRAATNALSKLATPHAMLALKRALKDSSPQVRATAAAGLSSRKLPNGQPSASTLLRALEGEGDVEVQIAILQALGRVANPEAVDRLIKAAEPDGRLFKRKPVAFRLAAVSGLGEARTPPALAALQELTTDRDKDVRDAAQRALAQVAPGDRLEPA
jgi:HEAT repeat protein